MSNARTFGRAAVATLAGATALQPVAAIVESAPAAAEAGCNLGDSQTYFTLPRSGTWDVQDFPGWRAKVTLQGDPYSYSTFKVYALGHRSLVDDFSFTKVAGRWDTGHFSEIVDQYRVQNFIGLEKTYEFRRSCMK